ncbi:unnamed protein product [Owenia fusiformis]|uniref:Uncharacterized protein n=1 Tax=Owenia fusiformis TaxID=6347 RepID=A0A8J1XS49_OWEFU|nr:unnamed protein product [Owenia fusiformis]
MKLLPKNTIHLISSSQVITSVVSVVKELLENSLDAGATSLEIKLENYGLDKIEIRDNGRGVSPEDTEHMCQPHYTSKINNHADLEILSTYGFRGEALHSICVVSDVVIITCTAGEEVGRWNSFDHHGNMINTKPIHHTTGTTIIIEKLFNNLPVRKQYYSSVKKKKEELKKVEDLVLSFGVILPEVRVTLRHGKDLIWQKAKLPDYKASLGKAVGMRCVNQMETFHREDSNTQVKLDVMLPRPKEQDCSRGSSDRCFIFVNNRPVVYKDVEKLLKKYYQIGQGQDGKFPVAFVNITVPSSGVDVNLEPNKTRVLIHNKDSVITMVTDILVDLYGDLTAPVKQSTSAYLSSKQDIEESNEAPSNIMKTRTTYELNTDDANGKMNSTGANIITPHKQFPSSQSIDHGDIVDDYFTGNDDTPRVHQHGNNGDNRDTCINTYIEGKSICENTLSASEHTVDRVNEIDAMTKVASDAIRNQNNNIQEPSSQKQCIDSEQFLYSKDQYSDNGDPQSTCKEQFSCENDIGDPCEKLDDIIIPTQAANFNIVSTQALDELDTIGEPILTQIKLREVHSEFSSYSDNETNKNSTVNDNILQDSDVVGMEVLERSDAETCSILSDEANVQPDDSVPCENRTEIHLSDVTFVETSKSNDHSKRSIEGTDHSESVQGTYLSESVQGTEHSESEQGTEHSATSIGGTDQSDINNDETISQGQSWSRGQQLLSKDGTLIQPVGMLTGGGKDNSMLSDRPAYNPSTPQSTHKPKTNSTLTPSQDQPTMFEMVGWSTIKRPQTAYIWFAKEIRPQVVRDNPEASFQDIARLMGERWQALSREGKEKYEHMYTEDVKRYKLEMSNSENRNKAIAKVSKKQRLVQREVSPKQPQKEASPPQREATAEISVERLKELYKHGFRYSQTQSKPDASLSYCDSPLEFKPIGVLRSHRVWIVEHERNIAVLNQRRAEEAFLYHQLQHNHVLPMVPLDSPIVYNMRDSGEGNDLKVLAHLKKQQNPPDPAIYLIDPRLRSNGLDVRCYPDEIGIVSIHQICDCLKNCAVAALKEILATIRENPSVTLAETRPTVISQHLQSEAVRMANNRVMPHSRADIVELMEQLHSLRTDTCPHNRIFLQQIYDLESIPQTQE